MTRTLTLPVRGDAAHRGTQPLNPARAIRSLANTLGIRRPRLLRGQRLERPLRAPVVSTPRLTLRPHRLADAAEWYALQSDPAVVRHIAWPLRTEKESRQHLKDRTRHTRLEQKDDFLALAIEHEGVLIGDVSMHLRDVDPHSRKAEIGWVLSPRAGGHGFATEAARAMLQIAIDELGARTVVAEIKPENERSIALARRLGFVPTGGTTWSLSAPRFDRLVEKRYVEIN